MATGIEVVALLAPEIWAASVAGPSCDLSTPDLLLTSCMEWADLECSCLEINHKAMVLTINK